RAPTYAAWPDAFDRYPGRIALPRGDGGQRESSVDGIDGKSRDTNRGRTSGDGHCLVQGRRINGRSRASHVVEEIEGARNGYGPVYPHRSRRGFATTCGSYG